MVKVYRLNEDTFLRKKIEIFFSLCSAYDGLPAPEETSGLPDRTKAFQNMNFFLFFMGIIFAFLDQIPSRIRSTTGGSKYRSS